MTKSKVGKSIPHICKKCSETNTHTEKHYEHVIWREREKKDKKKIGGGSCSAFPLGQGIQAAGSRSISQSVSQLDCLSSVPAPAACCLDTSEFVCHVATTSSMPKESINIILSFWHLLFLSLSLPPKLWLIFFQGHFKNFFPLPSLN